MGSQGYLAHKKLPPWALLGTEMVGHMIEEVLPI